MPEPGRAFKPTLEHDLQVLATTKLVEALVRSENSMRLRLDMLSEVVFELDSERRVSFLNGAWTKLSQRSLGQSLGSALGELLHAEDRPAIERLLGQQPAELLDSPAETTCRLPCSQGGERWVQISVVPTLARGWIGTMRDVTHVKHATDRLALLSLVADHTDNFVLITDGDGFIRWANRAFCNFTEYALDEVLGRKPGELLQGPDTDPSEIERIRGELRMRRSFRSEVLNYTRSGRPYWVTLHVTPIFDAEQRLQSFISVQSESTKLRELNEQLLREKLRAESASQAKSRFLSSISHELRTPLNALVGLLDVMRSTPIDERQSDYLDKMSTASRMLMQLINDVLDFSKIDADMMRVDPQPFVLIDLWEDVSDLLKAEASAKALEVRRRYEPGAAHTLVGDETRLRQILLNLTSNAVKFTERGSIELSMSSIQEHAGASTLEFCVADSGIGIAPDQLDSIFDAFSQAEASTSRRFGGSGLGLAISRRLAHLMGGTLVVESDIGRGSRFCLRVTLPRASPLPSRRSLAASRSRPRQALQGVRVLLAEDNPINQVVAREILRIEGASVQVVHDGLLAVEAVEQAPAAYDLVLMDLQMPRLDGHSAARMLRERFPQLPVLAMSANTGEQDRADSFAAGMRAHIGKPFDIASLVTAMLDALGTPRQPPGSRASTPVETHTREGHASAAAAPRSDAAPRACALLDVEDALSRLDGDSELYCRLLGSLQQQLDQLLDSLDDELPRGEQPWSPVHAVKGAAATLGLRELAAALAQCEDTLRGRGHAPWAQAHAALLDAAARTRPLIAQTVALRAPPQHPADDDGSEMQPLLEQLRRLLQDNDMQSLEIFRRLPSPTEPSRQASWQRIEQALQGLDFELALQELSHHET